MIAIVYPQFYGVGGIARYLHSFLANLPPSEQRYVYLITSDENRRVSAEFTNVEMIHIPMQSNRLSLLLWSLKARKIVNELYAKRKIQSVNLHIPPLISLLSIPAGVPMILTAHTTYLGMSGKFYDQHYYQSPWGVFSVLAKRLLELYLFKRASRIVTLTEQGKAEILRYGVSRPIDVIPNGVDLAQFRFSTNHDKEFDVIFSGRIELRKGSRPMVKLCKRLVMQKPDIKIVIVGYGEDEAYIKQELSHLPQITLTGKVDFTEMQAFYHASRLYVSTSYYEGLPGTCLEAMAMGIPVIVWDLMFYRPLVTHQKTGFVVATNQIDQMVNTILTVLTDETLMKVVAQQAHAHLMQSYQWPALASQLIQQFSESSSHYTRHQ